MDRSCSGQIYNFAVHIPLKKLKKWQLQAKPATSTEFSKTKITPVQITKVPILTNQQLIADLKDKKKDEYEQMPRGKKKASV